MLLTPILTVYSDMLGILGGWFIAVKTLNVANGPFWHYVNLGVGSTNSSGVTPTCSRRSPSVMIRSFVVMIDP